MFQQMLIEDYEIPVHLGCSEGERSLPQLVSFQVELIFAIEPHANRTDKIVDTICYASLCGLIQKTVGQRHFNMLEFLTQEVFDALVARLPPKTHMKLQAHKLHPPIDRLKGGVKYRIESPQ